VLVSSYADRARRALGASVEQSMLRELLFV